MIPEAPVDPGRFAQALHDLARAGAAALGYDLCAGRLPDDAPELAWAHHDYHRLAVAAGAACATTPLILGTGGQPARPRRRPGPPPAAREPIAWWDLDRMAARAAEVYRSERRWPGPASGRVLGSLRTWADLAVYLRRHGTTLDEFLDGRFPRMRGKA